MVTRTAVGLSGVAVVAVASAAVGCTALAGLDGDYVLAIDAGMGAAPDASRDSDRDASLFDAAPEANAPTLFDAAASAPPLVAVARGYSISAFEVTQRQYQEWLANAPPVRGQSPLCTGNTKFEPDAVCMMQACNGAACAEHPQVCIDWCDALAFCTSAGQRLCGKIDGGAEAPGDFATASASQWFGACTEDGTQQFPYGNGYHAAYCNGGENQESGCGRGGLCQTAITASNPRCIAQRLDGGPVYDLSGNAWEWTDACFTSTGARPDAGADGGSGGGANGGSSGGVEAGVDVCRIRGGGFRTVGETRLRCAGDGDLDVAGRTRVASDIGFRCCSK